MLERHETFIVEKYRRQAERQYAETHRLAKENGLQVSYYRKLACSLLIGTGERLIRLGKQVQSPLDAHPSPVAARME
jgi:hypothetical protein